MSQSNLLHCNNEWSAFSLSTLASCVAFFGFCQKFWTVWKLEWTIESDKASRQNMRSRGDGCKSSTEDAGGNSFGVWNHV